MLNYPKNEKWKKVFHKGSGGSSRGKKENLFLLGEDRQDSQSQKNPDGQLPLLDRRGRDEAEEASGGAMR